MTAENFAYWLQGYFELSASKDGLDAEQVKVIEDHLKLVFEKITPDRKVGQRQLLTEQPFCSGIFPVNKDCTKIC